MDSPDSHKSPPSGDPGRLPQLDGLRGIAALWVVLFHLTVRYEELFGQPGRVMIRIPDGRYGVHLFFMISGFVILLTLDKVRSIADFAFFRWARLYPTYWACGLITYIAVFLFGLPGRQVSLRDALVNITMLPHFLGFEFIDSVGWSLEVELFFYVLMGALVAFGLRRYLVAVLAFLVAADLVLLSFFDPVQDLSKIIKGLRFILCLRYLHLFLFGIVCYERARQKKWWQVPLLLCCLAASVLGQDRAPGILVLLLGGLFWFATQAQVGLLRLRWLLWIGFISYPLYLIHQNIGFILLRELESPGVPQLIAVPVAMLIVFSLAYLISITVEHPLNRRLRDWYRAQKIRTAQ